MAARRRPDPSRGGHRPVLADLKAGRISPLYLLHGPEVLLRDQLVRAIRLAVLPREAADFNHDRFHWPEAQAADVAAAAQTLPFMAPRRLIEVRGFELRTSEEEEEESSTEQDEEVAILLNLFSDLPETTVLLFTAEKADMRHKVFQRMREAGTALPMETPSESELPEWLRLQAEDLGFAVSSEAASLLVEAVEPSLSRLRAELEKLVAYVGPGREAGVEEVMEVVGRSRIEALYELGNALSKGNTSAALQMLHRLCDTKSPYAVVGTLRNQLKSWLSAKAFLLRKKSNHEMASILKMAPYRAERLMEEVQGVSGRFLRSLYGKLIEVDRRIKRSGDDRRRREALEMLILEMSQDPGGFRRGRRAGPGSAAARPGRA